MKMFLLKFRTDIDGLCTVLGFLVGGLFTEHHAICSARIDHETFDWSNKLIYQTATNKAGSLPAEERLFFLVLALVVVILRNSLGLQIGWGLTQYPEYVIGLATIAFVFGPL